jgi:hypothetical protein
MILILVWIFYPYLKADHHDIAEILLEVALNTISINLQVMGHST